MVETSLVRRGEVIEADARAAVAAFAAQVTQPDMAGVVLFCSSNYDPEIIAEAMRAHFDCPVVGCTTAGEIASTYQRNGIVGASFPTSHFRLHPVLITSMRDFGLTRAAMVCQDVESQLEFSRRAGADRMFGLLLVDGLSLLEERVVSNLYNAFNGMPIVGGSAGDDLQFVETLVYMDGRFHEHAAVLAVVETTLPFRVFRWQHFQPTAVDLVVTASDPDSRTVYEINGGMATIEYAAALGLRPEELDAHVFSLHPIMIQIGDEWYVRSIKQANADGSLTFLCAIDSGLPLTVANGVNYLEVLGEQIAALRADIGTPSLTIGCDCILRRIEILEKGIEQEVAGLLSEVNFMGFSTFGEQINGLHVNQTLTGIAIGEEV
ncbi:MAG: FIST N-terminal domain-containing protein [Rhodothermales bacterium]|nr:FIST N-terminal domain-containing protein [Rhodothermales bacterium]